MKNVVVIGFLFFAAIGVAEAQRLHCVDARQHHQRVRIREGITSGELTRPEVNRLRLEQRHIRRAERRIHADGVVTRGERARLHRKQGMASRHIRREKHDWQRVQ